LVGISQLLCGNLGSIKSSRSIFFLDALAEYESTVVSNFSIHEMEYSQNQSFQQIPLKNSKYHLPIDIRLLESPL